MDVGSRPIHRSSMIALVDHAQDRYVHALDRPPDVSPDQLTRLLGGKGANLVVMATELGLPVPPGFTITTEACAAALRGAWPDGLEDEIRRHMDRLGQRLGRRFGNPDDPLLVSVRSGAPVSMPGMMDTILNLGLTEAGTGGLARATGDEAFAADCLRRLRQGYRDVIGDDPPEDPWAQLRAAIDAVFRSWSSDRARAYRQREGIPDDFGTAVTVQAMVFGNRGADSATGVLFTRDPSTGERQPYGDVMFEAQGEDVVAGGAEPHPITELAERLPGVAAELRQHAELLERHTTDLCDIEFTVERGQLWLLQVRSGTRSPGAALRMAIDMAEDPTFPLSREAAVLRVAHLLVDPPRIFIEDGQRPTPMATGLPASPGIAVGEIATSATEAVRVADDGRPVILVRPETSPEDVAGMMRAAGVLTSRGGLASHAAVVARGWGIPAVVGAGEVRVAADGVDIGGRRLDIGETITIDGGSGEVMPGALGGHSEVVPEAATLFAWADQAGIEIERSPDAVTTVASSSTADGGARTVSDMDVLQALLVKGTATPEQLADALAVSPAAIDAIAGELVDRGLATSTDGSLGLSAEGKLRALEAFAAAGEAVGPHRPTAALDEFHALDARMKEIVTAWQMREVDGEQTLNDHLDAAYDGKVLNDLAALHADASAWLRAMSAALPRYATYATRLGRALELARGGDQRYVASPRVDSYHGAWFELHEDLIRLAGRRRADEAAAGRA
jgi:pyruvate,orthophosphate dikinase